jgi:flagellar biogenesis protein FliO
VIHRALAAFALFGLLISASATSLGVEPAGGPPFPDESDPVEHAGEAPDASVNERSWLDDRTGSSAADGTLGEAGATGSGFTLGAFIILLGLGGGAVALHLKRQKLSPIPKHESRLDVLSQSRIGPKAYAVTAHVGGRVMLLGVTDHNVTLLTWLDAQGKPDEGDAAEPEEADTSSDELPDDYPGSALRPSSVRPQAPLATTHDLKRFREALRGALELRKDSPLSRIPASPLSAASTLAAQTTDVVLSQSAAGRAAAPAAPLILEVAAAPGTTAVHSSAPASLRRKRQRRVERATAAARESAAPAQKNGAATSKTKAASSSDDGESSFEGQVAGLKSSRAAKRL